MRLRTSVAVATAFAAIFTGCGGASSSDQVNGAPAEDATTEEDQEFCDALRGRRSARNAADKAVEDAENAVKAMELGVGTIEDASDANREIVPAANVLQDATEKLEDTPVPSDISDAVRAVRNGTDVRCEVEYLGDWLRAHCGSGVGDEDLEE